jgi:threonine dehydrogenase-like Zn-dependent dehydrogenase
MSGIRTQAVLLDRGLTLHLGERDVPEPLPGQALVRLEWAGICGSDLHVMRTGDWVSDWPATLGHEIVGIVQRCPGGELAEGARVVVDSRVPCGSCAGCQRAANLCTGLRWVGEAYPGGLARQGVFPAAGLHPCPPELEAAVAVLAEPLAVAMHAVGRIPGQPSRACILGYGPIGALVHLELARRWPGIDVSVREIDPDRRELAEAFGAGLAAAGGDQTWPVVVDAAGYPNSLRDAIASTENGGVVLQVALGHAPITIDGSAIVEHALTIIGCNGFDAELPEAIAVLNRAPDAYRPLITEALLLEEAVPRLRELPTRPSVGKVVIRL